MKNDQSSELKFVDLFAGCGGLSLGLENAGFHPVLVNELNKDAMASYLVNRSDSYPLLETRYSVQDVKKLVLEDEFRNDLISEMLDDYGLNVKMGKLDLLVGGPPCQGFSGIGHRRSYSVDKKQLPSNRLYEDMAFLINEFQPRLFLFENVKGLLSARWTPEGDKGEIWEDVRSKFEELPGYRTRWSLVHAKDYGTPQNRPRVLLVGVRDDLNIELGHDIDAVKAGLLPPPTGKPPHIEDLLGDLVDPSYTNGDITEEYPSRPLNEVQSMLRMSREGLPSKAGDPLKEQEYSKHKPEILKKFVHMVKTQGEIPASMETKKFAQCYLPPVWGEQGPTITATSLPDDYVHFSQPRIPTVREWARLQMFPDWYRFEGKRTTGGVRRAGNPREGIFDRELPKYTQIGNAVPVSLATEVGGHFANLLRKSNNSK